MDINKINQANYINANYQANNIQNTNENINVVKEPKSIDIVRKDDNRDENKEYDEKDLVKSVKKLNKFLEDENVHAEYSIHKELNAIMIKIVDNKTKDVLMEIPSKKILDMIAAMCKQVGLIDKKA